MAKYGEGGKCWIVEERPNGANVHNWHWAKLIASPGRKRSSPNHFRISPSLTAKAIFASRPRSLSVSWEGEAKDGEGKTLLKAEGNLEIPDISDENADEDPKVINIIF
ncbi:activator of 90 kDa heat shock protein ATPase homolog 2-like [Gossypium hirsutum]|uniref:Activator of 90 kDa heat shock protein ATPase homolog 2-like n=1 Tax=Gossypium hirsutum TaxID=3635 RepID=A0ABM3BJA8_GOSHI|nr:activator of 90 kDa heat shock protein ATPase homolog 2-like [Gossypium hirsutum]